MHFKSLHFHSFIHSYEQSLQVNYNFMSWKANSAFHLSGVGKWIPALAGKAKAGMVNSVSRWMRRVQVKLWHPLRTRAIPEHLRGVFTTRHYTNPHLPLPYLPYQCSWIAWKDSLPKLPITASGALKLLTCNSLKCRQNVQYWAVKWLDFTVYKLFQ